MNVVDAFFQAPDWPATFAVVHQRRADFLAAEAGAAMQKYKEVLSSSELGRQVFNMYLQVLQTGVAQGVLAMVELLESIGMMPKLREEDVRLLAAATDAATSKPLWRANPALATALLANQSLEGEAFWSLLAGSAQRVEEAHTAEIRESGQPVRVTVIMNDAGNLRRVLKIIPLSDGGLSLTTPYHKAREGILYKVPCGLAVGTSSIPVEDMVPFSATDRVKLSYHVDGFAQFSGEDNARILSGWDRDTGLPRGLGLMSAPLHSPITSGPSIGCSIWGLSDFEDWKPKARDQPLRFHDEDFYWNSEYVADGVLGYTFSMFIIPTSALLCAIGPFRSGTTIEVNLPMRVGARDMRFRAKLVVLGGPTTGVVLAERTAFEFLERSGFQLLGPSDRDGGLLAFYPRPPVADLGTSLDRLAQP